MIALNKVDRLKPGAHRDADEDGGGARRLPRAPSGEREDEGRRRRAARRPRLASCPRARRTSRASRRPTCRSRSGSPRSIREKALQLTREEVPHAITVEVEEMDEKRACARSCYVETESQKGILVGKKGAMVREIGTRARPEVEALVGASGLPRAAGQGAAEVAPRPEAMLERLGSRLGPPGPAELHSDAWRRRPHSRRVRAPVSSRGCRGSARSTPSRSRSAPPTLAKRSIKRESKLFALELAIRMMDLTTLEGAGHARQGRRALLEGGAARPGRPDVPSVAAICVYPNLVPTAVERLRGSGVKVASVATAFPSGQSPIDVKLAEVRCGRRARAPTRSTW